LTTATTATTTMKELLALEDVLTQHVFTNLTSNDLVQCAQCSKFFHELILNEEKPSCAWIFKQLVLSYCLGAVVNNKDMLEQERKEKRELVSNKLQIEYSTMSHPSWFQLYREYVTLKFDSSFSQGENKTTNVFFDDFDRVVRTDYTDTVWESACTTHALKPGSVFKWKFGIERWESTGNSYEVVLGVSVQDKTSTSFNSDHDIVYMRNYNCGMGFNLGLWELRVGQEHKPFTSEFPAPENVKDCTPFTVGFIFDYTNVTDPTLHIYFEDNFVTKMSPSTCGLQLPEVQPVIFYPTASICRNKTVKVLPWL
jgi:hypothetical protein